MTYALLGILQLLSGFSTFLYKKLQLGIKINMPSMMLCNMISACFASAYFLLLCKMHIEMNLITFVYSFVYAVLVMYSSIMSIIALSKLSISFNSVISTAAGVSGSVFFGIFMFGEGVSIKQLAGALLLVAAVAVSAFSGVELKREKNSATVCVLLFLSGFLSQPIIKMYTCSEGVLDINNMFFMTNVITVVITAVYTLIYTVKNGTSDTAERTRGILNKTAVANIASRTAICNVITVISAFVVANMDLTVYTVLSLGLGIIVSGCLSKFIFREHLAAENYISILLALIAVVIRVI